MTDALTHPYNRLTYRRIPASTGSVSLTGKDPKKPFLTAVLLGLGNAFSLHPRGGITVSHVCLVVILPIVLPVVWRLRAVRWVLALLLLWVCGVTVTSLVTGDSAFNIGLAFSYPLSIAMSFCAALWVYLQGPSAAKVFTFSLSIALLVAAALYPTDGFEVDPWKYSFGCVVTLCCILVATSLLHRCMRVLSLLLVGSIALVNLVNGFRSMFLITAVALIVTVVSGRQRERRRWSRCLLAGASLSFIAVVLPSVYGQLADRGTLGAEQQAKWNRQSRSDSGVLLGARPEFAGSIALISESPLIGRGVKPQVDMRSRQLFFTEWRKSNGGVEGLNERQVYFGRGLLVHSVLFQRWLETGILVLPGLILPIGLVLMAALNAIRAGSAPPTLVFSFMLSLLLWDLFFSPWSRLEGLFIGTAAAAAVAYQSSAQYPGGTESDRVRKDVVRSP